MVYLHTAEAIGSRLYTGGKARTLSPLRARRFVLTLEAQVHPAVYAAVGGFVVGGNLSDVLPYNGVAGHWSSVLLWSQALPQALRVSACRLTRWAVFIGGYNIAILSSSVKLWYTLCMVLNDQGGV
jgi:hypothetical protein